MNTSEELQIVVSLEDKFSDVLKKMQKNVGTISQKIESKFTKALKQADKQANSLINSLKKISKAVVGIGTITIGTIAVTGAKDYLSVEEQLAKTASTGGFDKYSEEFARIKEVSENIAGITSKTQAEVLEGMEKMYLAGWDTSEVTGSIEGMTKFAIANSEDLVNVIDLVTDGSGATGLAIDELSDYFDVLTKASTLANATVSEFLESTLKSGAGLRSVNTGLEEMVALQGVLANSGFKGSESGTALNSLSNRLYKSSGEGYIGRQMIGVDIVNDDGTVKSLDKLFMDISTALNGRSEAEINEAITYLFGEYKAQGLAILNSLSSAEDTNINLVNALNNLSKEVGSELEDINLKASGDYFDLLEEIQNSSAGAVDFKYNIQTDTLVYDLETLKSAFSKFSIAFIEPFGEKARGHIQKLSETLSNLSEKARAFSTTVVENLSSIFNFVKDNKGTIITGISGISTALISFIGIVKGAKIYNFLNEFSKTGKGLGAIVSNILHPIKNLEKNSALLSMFFSTKGMDKVGKGLQTLTDNILHPMKKIGGLKNLSKTFKNLFNPTNLIGGLKNLSKTFKNLFNPTNLIGGLKNLSKTFKNLFNPTNLIGGLKSLSKVFIELFSPTNLISGLKTLSTAFLSLFNPIKMITKVFDLLKTAFLTNPFGFIATTIGILVVALVKLYQNSETFRNKVNTVFGNIKERLTEFGQTMFELWEAKIKPIWEKIKNLFVNESGEISTVWVNLGSALMDTIELAVDFILTSVEWLAEWLVPIISNIIDHFQGWIDFISGIFTLNWGKAWDGVKRIFSSFWDFIKNIINACIDGLGKLTDFVGNVGNKIKGWFGFGDDTEIKITGTEYSETVRTLNINSQDNDIPEFALGTSYFTGGLARINERGGELQVLSNGTAIIPADKTDALLNGANGGVNLNININGNVIGEERYINLLGNAIYKKIAKTLPNLS